MRVELIFITPDPEAHIGAQAAECYDSKTDRESCLRRAVAQEIKRQLAEHAPAVFA